MVFSRRLSSRNLAHYLRATWHQPPTGLVPHVTSRPPGRPACHQPPTGLVPHVTSRPPGSSRWRQTLIVRGEPARLPDFLQSPELRQEPDVIVIQQADILDAVLDHRNALNPHPERITCA